MNHAEARTKLLAIANAIVETVREAGPEGAPASFLFIALQENGCTIEQFETIMSVLVEAGKLTRRDNLYFAVGGTK